MRWREQREKPRKERKRVFLLRVLLCTQRSGLWYVREKVCLQCCKANARQGWDGGKIESRTPKRHSLTRRRKKRETKTKREITKENKSKNTNKKKRKKENAPVSRETNHCSLFFLFSAAALCVFPHLLCHIITISHVMKGVSCAVKHDPSHRVQNQNVVIARSQKGPIAHLISLFAAFSLKSFRAFLPSLFFIFCVCITDCLLFFSVRAFVRVVTMSLLGSSSPFVLGGDTPLLPLSGGYRPDGGTEGGALHP